MAGIFAAALSFVTPADAAQIFIQQSGTSPAGGDPNVITDTSAFVVGIAGNHTTESPVLIGVADYNGLGPAPTISFADCASPSACPLATIGTYGLDANTATLTSGTVYNAVGLSAGGSVSFGNLSDADQDLGLAPATSYALYMFALPTGLSGGSPITIDTTAGFGDFIFAYSCSLGSGTGACSGGDRDQTVFTNTAVVGTTTPPPVPEPASLALLGSALVGFGILRRRKRA